LKKNKKKITRWLGLQGGKYVSLPAEWVALNFDEGLLKEATERAENALTKREWQIKDYFHCPWVTPEMTILHQIYVITRV
jgi:hypothetical protein